MKKGILTAIEITDTHVKLLEAREQRDAPLISLCIIQDIERSSDDSILHALSTMIKRGKGRGPRECVLIIPRRSVILKQVSLPSHDKDELSRMLDLQIASLVPYSREDIIFDFYELDKDAAGYTKILLVAVHKNIVTRYVSILNNAGFEPTKIIVSSFGVLEWVSYEGMQKEEQPAPIAFIHLDYKHSEICFCYNKNLMFSRHINLGVIDLEKNFNGFIEQIGLTFGAYRKSHMGADVSRVIILSDMPSVGESIKNTLKNYYNFTVDIFPVSKKFLIDKGFDFSSLREDEGISILPAAGSLISGLLHTVNLMPLELEDKQRWQARKQKIMQFVSLFLIVILLAAGALWINVYEEIMQLNVLKTKVADARQNVDLTQKSNQLMDFIREEVQERVFIADVIEELHILAPEEITFQSVFFNYMQGVTIQGLADNDSRVNKFQSQLMESPLFKDVTLQYATRRKRFKEEYTDFKMTFQLRPLSEQIK
jgi:Tfp pilus assembly PilM family ATPase/Tfp pilus assembly protein PilN